MKHGKSFVEDHPNIGTLIERLYKKRELDDWYLRKCGEKFAKEHILNDIIHITSIEILASYRPSVTIVLHTDDMTDSDELFLAQKIVLNISKLTPVYTLDFSFQIKHHLLGDFVYSFSKTTPESLVLLQASTDIRRKMKSNGHMELSYLYDYYDTVYEWSELQNIKPINRSLMVGDALFSDVLGLC